MRRGRRERCSFARRRENARGCGDLNTENTTAPPRRNRGKSRTSRPRLPASAGGHARQPPVGALAAGMGPARARARDARRSSPRASFGVAARDEREHARRAVASSLVRAPRRQDRLETVPCAGLPKMGTMEKARASCAEVANLRKGTLRDVPVRATAPAERSAGSRLWDDTTGRSTTRSPASGGGASASVAVAGRMCVSRRAGNGAAGMFEPVALVRRRREEDAKVERRVRRVGRSRRVPPRRPRGFARAYLRHSAVASADLDPGATRVGRQHVRAPDGAARAQRRGVVQDVLHEPPVREIARSSATIVIHRAVVPPHPALPPPRGAQCAPPWNRSAVGGNNRPSALFCALARSTVILSGSVVSEKPLARQNKKFRLVAHTT